MNTKRNDLVVGAGHGSKTNLLPEAVTIIEYFLYGGKVDIERDAMVFLQRAKGQSGGRDLVRSDF